MQRIPEWEELTQEERGNAVGRLDSLALAATQDLAGLKKLLARDYDINSTLEDLKRFIQRQGQERKRHRLEEMQAKEGKTGPSKLSKRVKVPKRIGATIELDVLIQQLQDLKSDASLYAELDITFAIDAD